MRLEAVVQEHDLAQQRLVRDVACLQRIGEEAERLRPREDLAEHRVEPRALRLVRGIPRDIGLPHRFVVLDVERLDLCDDPAHERFERATTFLGYGCGLHESSSRFESYRMACARVARKPPERSSAAL